MTKEYSDIKDQLVDIYRARAKRYDITANLYYLIGYPEWRYRRQAVQALALDEGDTVVEIGCGTGLNFAMLQQRIGPAGQLIGVDLTGAMLDEARRRVVERGWRNVELVHSDALEYDFPQSVNGVISTYALSLIPACDKVIQHAARALDSGGHLSLLELKVPERWPGWLVDLALMAVRPFALSEEWLARKPWQSIGRAMRDTLAHVHVEERYLGTTYIISGCKMRHRCDGRCAALGPLRPRS